MQCADHQVESIAYVCILSFFLCVFSWKAFILMFNEDEMKYISGINSIKGRTDMKNNQMPETAKTCPMLGS